MPEIEQKPPLKVLLCSPRGFCAGVVRAIDSVERALEVYGPPVYVRHEIVHNRFVVESLERQGASGRGHVDCLDVVFEGDGNPVEWPSHASLAPLTIALMVKPTIEKPACESPTASGSPT